jgi:hypothetical protein
VNVATRSPLSAMLALPDWKCPLASALAAHKARAMTATAVTMPRKERH